MNSRHNLATAAVVVRRVPYRDADLIVDLFTRERGKVTAVARGARSSRRRFAGGLGLFALGIADLRRSPRAELFTLQAFEVSRSFPIAADLAAVAHGSYGTELVRELSPPEQPEPAVFELLVELYESLAAAGAEPRALRAFELRLLDYLGVAPVLSRCVGCGGEANGDDCVLDAARGGVLCPGCGRGASGAAVRALSGAALGLLVAAACAPSLAAARDLPAVPSRDAARAREAMLALLHAHLGKPLRSVQFIAKVTAFGAGGY